MMSRRVTGLLSNVCVRVFVAASVMLAASMFFFYKRATDVSLALFDSKPVQILVVSPGENLIGIGDRGGGLTIFSNEGTSAPFFRCQPDGGVSQIAFAENKKRMAFSTWSGLVQIWDFENNRAMLLAESRENGKIACLLFAHDDGSLVIGEFGGRISIIDIPNRSTRQLFSLKDIMPDKQTIPGGLFFSKENNILAVGAYGRILFWSFDTRCLLSESCPVEFLAVDPIFTGANNLSVFDSSNYLCSYKRDENGRWTRINRQAIGAALKVVESLSLSRLIAQPHGGVTEVIRIDKDGSVQAIAEFGFEYPTSLAELRSKNVVICGDAHGKLTFKNSRH